ncbi:MAG: hypothetical protein ACP5OA_06055 [Candidatus Woesearchaeota archaeon]
MNKLLLDLLDRMLRRRIIGAKHTPEDLMIRQKLKQIDNNSRKDFYQEYNTLIKQNYFIRLKKRTGKGSDWHISLNPEMIEEINELLEAEDEI